VDEDRHSGGRLLVEEDFDFLLAVLDAGPSGLGLDGREGGRET
jgi:hypothetical protein